MNRYAIIAFGLAICITPDLGAREIEQALQAIRAVGPEGAGHEQATIAWSEISQADSTQLIEILAAMRDGEPLAGNWLRAAVDTIAQRERRAGRELPKKMLIEFLKNTEMSPRGRRTAYELLQTIVPDAEQQFIPGMVNDPSLELRRDAVALLLAEAKQLRDTDKTAAIAKYGQAFRAARDTDQIEKAYEELAALDTKVDLARHYGFLMRWHIVAPFDNTDTRGFEVAYPPESGVNLAAKYIGKAGQQTAWQRHVTDDPHGIVDFNKALDNYKGAIGYAYTEFISPKNQTVDVRLGCINGNKVWINGEEITSNHVYHSGMEIDQYVAQVDLKKGKNQILIKLAQNEQTEQWAQRWQFQLRVCDAIGTAILSVDRPLPEKTATRDRTINDIHRGLLR